MEGLDPITAPWIYDTVVLATLASPGLATLEGFERPYGWEAKKAKGSSGAKITYQGEDLAEGEVELRLWEPEHFAQWDVFRGLLAKAQDPKKIQALDILHPFLTDQAIYSVVVVSIGLPKRDKGGLWRVRFKLKEYREPKAAGGSPKGSKGGVHQSYTTTGGGPIKNYETVVTSQKRDLDELVAETQGDTQQALAQAQQAGAG